MTDLNRPAALGLGTAALALAVSGAATAAPRRVQALKITVLSTMLADEGLGEWGYCARRPATNQESRSDIRYRTTRPWPSY